MSVSFRSFPADYIERLAQRDLSGCDLSGVDLSDRDLESVNFSEANLSNSTLCRAILKCADFQNAKLCGADLRLANLEYANFGRTNMSGAILRDATLQNANLQDAVGLLPEQLAGTNLSGAKLPAEMGTFSSLSIVKETSANAKALYISLFLACLYSWLTIGTTRDVQLLTDSASSPLPIIQTSVPIVGFYILAPLLLLGAYLYFHFYLQNLWEELSILPAVFPDGRPLFAKSDPWLLNDMVRAYLPHLTRNRPFISYLEEVVSIVLAWWFVPFTFILFWFRYLTRQDWKGTILHIVLTAFNFMAATSLRALAQRTLQGHRSPPFSLRNSKQLLAGGPIAAGATVAFILLCVSSGTINGDDSVTGLSPKTWIPKAMRVLGYRPFADFTEKDVSTKPPNWTGKDPSQVDLVKGASLRGSSLRYLDARRSFLVNADMVRTDLRSANLSGANLEHADLDSSDLRRADIGIGAPWEEFLIGAGISAPGTLANLQRTNLHEADLRGAHLLAVQLQEANLTFSNLQGAVLSGVDLSGADLRDAELDGLSQIRTETLEKGIVTAQVELAQKQLDRACGDENTRLPFTPMVRLSIPLCPDKVLGMLAQHKLWHESKGLQGKQAAHRNLSELKLDYAFLEGSNFSKGRLLRTILSFSDLSHANLQGAMLNGSILASANLSHAVLREADLQGGILDHADLTDADLEGADLSKASLVGTNLERANLINVKGVNAEQIRQSLNWQSARFDSRIQIALRK
jgi:uncharacterized protein YjbI with pentapeptide repeats